MAAINLVTIQVVMVTEECEDPLNMELESIIYDGQLVDVTNTVLSGLGASRPSIKKAAQEALDEHDQYEARKAQERRDRTAQPIVEEVVVPVDHRRKHGHQKVINGELYTRYLSEIYVRTARKLGVGQHTIASETRKPMVWLNQEDRATVSARVLETTQPIRERYESRKAQEARDKLAQHGAEGGES